MNLTIPILVEEQRASGANPGSFLVRPLFAASPERRAQKLSRALTALTNDLHALLREAGNATRHDALAGWSADIPFTTRMLNVRIELRSGSERHQFFLVSQAALGRRICFLPRAPEIVFEYRDDENLDQRAEEVLTRYFRDTEKSGDSPLSAATPAGTTARVIPLEIVTQPASNGIRVVKDRGASLFGGPAEKPDGEAELRKTGRRLNALFPDDLDRAVGRDHEVAELSRILSGKDRRAVLLVGPRQSGKSAVLHECVWRSETARLSDPTMHRDVWQVSPMRLISGMSYLGEWEDRVLAILDHLEKRDAVLCIDDLPGIFTAGQSAGSDMNVAQLLQPRLEERRVRLVAEVTPEMLRVMREKNRALADLFHILPVSEPSENETLRILCSVVRKAEEDFRCRFALDVIPTVYELHRRFAGDAAFPGKAAGFLGRVARKCVGGGVDVPVVLNEFSERTGLQVDLLRGGDQLEREHILFSLSVHVKGQAEALDAFADTILKLAARLNDTRRPLATMLLLGPTGVGKTQAAKALARVLFGSEERLLRFDMNEYLDAGAAARLCGTAQNPDGLLSGAIRRQPFAVVLFDEIEKAAPEVFDTLLAVLDEGRLTDSLGRLADFGNAIILLTSNLGAKDSRSRVGFDTGNAADPHIYTRAAEKFFRPEFFNRLDRVIPFRELSRDELREIAGGLLAGLFRREGMMRRSCVPRIAPEALELLVDLGNHPQLGARALKRVVEREVVQPLASKLAGVPPDMPIIANFHVTDGRLDFHISTLRPMERVMEWTVQIASMEREGRAREILDAAGSAIDALEDEIDTVSPGPLVALDGITPEQEWYFLCREQLARVDRMFESCEAALAKPRKRTAPLATARTKSVAMKTRIGGTDAALFHAESDAERFHSEIQDIAAEEEFQDTPIAAMVREVALLNAMVAGARECEQAALVIATSDEGCYEPGWEFAKRTVAALRTIFGDSVECTTQLEHSPVEELLDEIFSDRTREPSPKKIGIFARGPGCRTLMAAIGGVMLVKAHGRNITLVSTAFEGKSRADFEGLEAQFPEGEEIPVIQIHRDKFIHDCRTGLSLPERATPDEWRAFLLSALPLPAMF